MVSWSLAKKTGESLGLVKLRLARKLHPLVPIDQYYYLLSSGSTLRTQQTKIFDRKQGKFCSRTIEYILSTLGISRFFVKFTMHDFLINSCLYFLSFFIKFSSTQYSSFNTIQDLVTFEVGSYYFYIMLIDYSMHLELIG